MEIETLKKDNRKYWIIGSVVVIILASVIFFVSTRANYKVTEKVNIANGIINWSQSDLDIIAIKISSDGNNYADTNTVPTSGYILNKEKSVCKVNGIVDSNISIKYSNGEVSFLNLKKSSKCTLYFDEGITIANVLSGLTKLARTDFSVVLTENTTGKIYTAEDNDGTSYYYAGAVDNNWVKFGGFYWRIIRINGDGTIRLIYNGTTTDQTGSGTQIGTSVFNSNNNDNTYVGYMYGTAGSSTYEATHANTHDSIVKQTVDNWYNTNLNKSGVREYIDANAGFCGDRSLASGTGIGTTSTNYGAYNRLSTNKTPSFKCTNSNDLYTVSSSNKGNKALTYPVGLISADEVAYAGGVYKNYASNQSYYLYTNSYYWTMTPVFFSSGGPAYGLSVYPLGFINNNIHLTNNVNGARPVINLRSDTVFKSGTDGTTSNPYEVA